MPYIKYERSEELDRELRALDVEGWQPGDLAYALFVIWNRYYAIDDGERTFADYASMSGVVHETWAEFRRRIITPYEQRKRKENGDVL